MDRRPCPNTALSNTILSSSSLSSSHGTQIVFLVNRNGCLSHTKSCESTELRRFLVSKPTRLEWQMAPWLWSVTMSTAFATVDMFTQSKCIITFSYWRLGLGTQCHRCWWDDLHCCETVAAWCADISDWWKGSTTACMIGWIILAIYIIYLFIMLFIYLLSDLLMMTHSCDLSITSGKKCM